MSVAANSVAAQIDTVLRRWKGMRVRFVRLRCGPFDLMEEVEWVEEASKLFLYDPGLNAVHEVEYVVTHLESKLVTEEKRSVRVGSHQWHGRRYFLFKCIYGLIKDQGFLNQEWDDLYFPVCKRQRIKVIKARTSFLRVHVPEEGYEPLVIEDFSTFTFLKVTPVARRNQNQGIPNQEIPLYQLGKEESEPRNPKPSRMQTISVGQISKDDEYYADRKELPTAKELGKELGFVSE